MSDADYTAAPSPAAGGPGHRHHEGSAFRRGFTRRERWLVGLMLFLCIVMSGGALVSQQIQQHGFESLIAARHAATLSAQARTAAAEQAKLCSVLEPLAALTPPPGASSSTPARVYEVRQAAILAKVAPAAGCRK